MYKFSNMTGKVAVVTGSARGIGRGIALALSEKGFKVIVNFRKSEREAKKVVSSIREKGGEAAAFKADVTKPEHARRLINTAVSKWNRLDILVNNVGDFLVKNTSATDSSGWRKIVDSNLMSAVNCSYYAQKEMRRRRWGRIVNIGYAESERVGAFPRIAAYASSKTAVIILTKSLAKELAPFGITVNCVSPGIMESSIAGSKIQKKMLKKIPAGRIGKAEDVASAVIWLVSDEASYVTGANVVVSGGWGI
ncbi:MAG: SDR family oxidoreductase [Candidatus Eisenbacteria bacterium]|nr:SDR family oxidoreductase [Candidatus Eisenbacteria bacterium]